RIGDGMDDVVTERERLAFAQGLGASGLDSAARIRWQAPPQDVVFSPSVDADHRPHLMIVGHDSHVRSPDDVEDCEMTRAVKHLDLRPNRLAQCFQHSGGILDRPSYDLAYGLQGCPAGHCGRALSFEPVEIKHGNGLLQRLTTGTIA